MNLFYYISDFIIPILIVYILVTGLAAKIPVYDEFVKGAAEGIHTVLKILPTLVGIDGGSGNAAGIGIPGTDLEAADSTGAMDPFSGGTGSTGNRALVFFLGCYIIGTGHL